MPRDERAREVATWFDRASEDLRAASVDLEVSPPLLADAGFHCQQAVEKAMKGLFVADEAAFGKTHDLRALGDVLTQRHPELEKPVDEVAELTEYAWRFRYPGDPIELSKDDLRAHLDAARGFVQLAHGLATRPLDPGDASRGHERQGWGTLTEGTSDA